MQIMSRVRWPELSFVSYALSSKAVKPDEFRCTGESKYTCGTQQCRELWKESSGSQCSVVGKRLWLRAGAM